MFEGSGVISFDTLLVEMINCAQIRGIQTIQTTERVEFNSTVKHSDSGGGMRATFLKLFLFEICIEAAKNRQQMARTQPKAG